MFHEEDPFLQASADLDSVLKKSKIILSKINSTSFVDNNDLGKIKELKEEAVDLLNILRDAIQMLLDMSGRINGRVFSPNEIVERQNSVKLFEKDVDNLEKMYHSLSGRREAVQSSLQPEDVSDNYVLLQEREQRDQIAQQEEVMDRLAHGLRELRDTGINIHNELDTQNVMLADVDRDVTSLQARLHSANEKVDRLLGSLSNRGKILIICCLMGLLFFLFLLY